MRRPAAPTLWLGRSSRKRINENQENGRQHSDDDGQGSSSSEREAGTTESEAGSSDSELEALKQEVARPRRTRSGSQAVLSNLSQNNEQDAVSLASASNRASASPSLERTPGTMDGDDSDWCPRNGESPNGLVRRSARTRSAKSNTLSQSWILGGGGGALGYPTRLKRRAENDLKKVNEHEVGVSNESELPEENEINISNQIEESSADDLYCRVKDPHRSRSSRRVINYRENIASMDLMEVDHEPVSRRLRDRKAHVRNIVNIRDDTRGCGDVTKRRNILRGPGRRRRKIIETDSSSTSSTDSDDYCARSQSIPRRHESHKEKERNISRKSFMGDIQPIAVDTSITFASVGGLDSYVNKMKEIVIFPLIYKEFFSSRNIAPPRGILFHGPPGTGKTLLARALANECSTVGGKPVSFFMRKGADILNKWVGESERQLKMLFEQASIHQPSIIFFDELDGLAPVRSAKTDQVHNSIVSTLLAELDGIKDRGEIVVIGATNRVDSIDPALRRPGRFDHEFAFFLPSHEARRSILNVHLKDWKDSIVSEYFIDQLADMTVGYSGADLRLLCSEANMCALRRRYPQIYSSKEKLVLNYSSVQVERRDWEAAMTTISRSSDRSIFSSNSTGSPLPHALRPILSRSVKVIRERLDKIFPYRSPAMKEPSRKRLLVYSEAIELTEHVLPAVLHTMDSIPVYTLSIQTLALNESDGKGVALLFGEATKRSTVSIIYVPSIDMVYEVLGESGQKILLSELYKTAFNPVLILASAREALPDELATHFGEVSMRLPKIVSQERMEFFRPIFEKNALQVKWTGEANIPAEVLPVAPPELKTWTAAEIAALEKTENRTITQLKIFLRDTIHKIARNKKFVEFTKPVNLEEVPDYNEIIANPMDLETMMCKVNQCKYLTKAAFNEDIELIVSNALNYNPAKSETDMRIRHRAYELRDFVFIELEEMDSDFDEKCCSIQKARQERENCEPVNIASQEESQDVKTDLDDSQQYNSQAESEPKSGQAKSPRPRSFKKRRLSSWAKGITPGSKKFKKKVKLLDTSPPSSVECSPVRRSPDHQAGHQKENVSSQQQEQEQNSKTPLIGTQSSSISSPTPMTASAEIPDEYGFITSNNSEAYIPALQNLLQLVVERTKSSTTRQLLELRFQLLRATENHNTSHEKKDLLLEINAIVDGVKGVQGKAK